MEALMDYGCFDGGAGRAVRIKKWMEAPATAAATAAASEAKGEGLRDGAGLVLPASGPA